MNFKTLFLLCPFILGCGVKGDPRPPGDTMLPSVEAYYLEDLNKPDIHEKENEEKNKANQKGKIKTEEASSSP